MGVTVGPFVQAPNSTRVRTHAHTLSRTLSQPLSHVWYAHGRHRTNPYWGSRVVWANCLPGVGIAQCVAVRSAWRCARGDCRLENDHRRAAFTFASRLARMAVTWTVTLDQGHTPISGRDGGGGGGGGVPKAPILNPGPNPATKAINRLSHGHLCTGRSFDTYWARMYCFVPVPRLESAIPIVVVLKPGPAPGTTTSPMTDWPVLE